MIAREDLAVTPDRQVLVTLVRQQPHEEMIDC
jgi:hypothetical protein